MAEYPLLSIFLLAIHGPSGGVQSSPLYGPVMANLAGVVDPASEPGIIFVDIRSRMLCNHGQQDTQWRIGTYVHCSQLRKWPVVAELQSLLAKAGNG